jgi:hypothetical protein
MPSEAERYRQKTRVAALILVGLTIVSTGSARTHALSCPDTGIGSVSPSADGLLIERSAVSSLRSGDILLQLNNHRLQSCADLAQALSEARRNQLTALLLIRRADKTDAVLLDLPVAPAQQVAVARPTVVPLSPVPTTAPTPLTRPNIDAARALLVELGALGRDLQAHQPLPIPQPWAQRIDQLRQTYDREQVSGAGVGVVEPILGYYETVGQILVYKDAETRGRREVRARAEVILEYHNSSPVGGWLSRYPFLRASVVREPETTHFITESESNGQWLPDQAVALLVARAVSEGAALSAALAAGTSP